MGVFGNTFGGNLGTSRTNSVQLPLISDIAISLITDVGFTVTCQIDPKGTLIPVLHYGETTSYGSTQNGVEISEAGEVVFNLITLASWTDYYIKVVAGNTELVYNNAIQTLTPIELTDGNNYGHYKFDESSNMIETGNLVSQFRDIIQANALSAELYNNPGFDAVGTWQLASGWSISGGKLNGVAGVSSNAYQEIGINNAVYRHSFTIDSISGSYTQNANLLPVSNKTTPGTYEEYKVCGGAGTNVAIGMRKHSSTTVVADNFSLKRVLGNHLTQGITTNQPGITASYINFDGIDNYLRTATGVASIGTIYIVAQRVGTDSDFTVLNNLAGIGEYTSNRLTIGANNALSAYYNLRIKEILIRSVSDSANTQSKLNAYFEKKNLTDGYLTPLGKTTSPATNASARQFIVTLIDDDASDNWDATSSGAVDYPYQGGFYTRLHPVIVAANRYLLANNLIQPGEEIGACSATFVSGMTKTGSGHNKNKYLQLRCLQDVYGWEIANHSNSHFMSQETGVYDTVQYVEENTLEAEINGAKDSLENTFGFNISSFIYPGGRHSHLIRDKVKERHTSAYAVSYSFNPNLEYNIPPIPTFAITRMEIEHTSDANGNLINPTTALNFLKGKVDTAKTAKGWIVTMSHMAGVVNKNYNALYPDPTYPESWFRPVGQLTDDWTNDLTHIVPEGWYPYPNSLLDVIYKWIIYIYEQGGKIMLPREAIQQYGNLSETGDVTFGVQGLYAINDELYYEHKAKGVDGSITAYRSS